LVRKNPERKDWPWPEPLSRAKARSRFPRIREQLGLKAGVRFECYVDRDGQVVLVPLTVKLEDLIGVLPYKGPPKTVEEVNEAIAEAAIERATRGLEGT
jgi:bifunctional DNA-binding transcriptional regulator/antitoxin component of YhaV-PrlF toxin-antitoxin module